MLHHSKQLYAIADELKSQQFYAAVGIAKMAHCGQTRCGGGHFFIHPAEVALDLYALGIRDDDILAAAVLHDLLEDCKGCTIEFLLGHGISEETVRLVAGMTKFEGYSTDEYFEEIAKCEKCTLLKLADRRHNLATMESFKPARRERFIAETLKYVLPLTKKLSGSAEYSSLARYYDKEIRSLVV